MLDSTLALPADAMPQTVTTTAAFKKQVVRVVFAIIFFILVYLLLVIAGFATAAGFIYLGGLTAVSLISFFGIVAGIGLIAVGVSLIFFLVKFIFSSSKDEKKSRVEITELEQPELFAFIRNLTREVGVPFPKKIFVSPDVNAAVFYNSSFFSMFFPIKKNLEIGLGLVNSLNESEFKAVLAHEFGHFSQRSMKLGSFTFNVNRIIWNMLFENEGYHSFLNKWARVNNVTLLLGHLTVKITSAMQWVLRQMYKLVNKSYLALSREMEFHADAVAASVAGGNNLISALMQIQVASDCYNTTIAHANAQLQAKRVFKNIFANQRLVFRELATEKKFSLENDLPRVPYDFIQSTGRTRINFTNQWASHPTFGERKQHLELQPIYCASITDSAWKFINNRDALQEALTQKVYSFVEFKENPETMEESAFSSILEKERSATALPEFYKGYYDNRYPQISETDLLGWKGLAVRDDVSTLFSPERCALPASIQANKGDVQLLLAISESRNRIDSFDFDGMKYKRREAEEIIQGLNAEVEKQEADLNEADLDVFAFCMRHSHQREEEVMNLYRDYAFANRYFNLLFAPVSASYERLDVLFRGTTSIAEIQSRITLFKDNEEPALKEAFRTLLTDRVITDPAMDKILKLMQVFTDSDYSYFNGNKYFDNEMNDLKLLLESVIAILGTTRHQNFRKLALGQLESFSVQ